MSSHLETKKNICENLISEFISFICKFQYDKAKSCADKLKDSNSKIMLQMQTIFIHLINGEKFYNNLAFLNHKTISKDKYYDSASPLLDQIVKENSLGRAVASSFSNMSSYDAISNTSLEGSVHSIIDKAPVDNLLGFIDSLSQFIEFRHQMMKFYFDLKDKVNIEASLRQLIEIERRQTALFTHPLATEIKSIASLEIKLTKLLLTTHIAIDVKFDCIKSIVSIKSINDIFLTRLPLLNSKQSKETKSFMLFTRVSSNQRLMPVLYQWYKLYYQSLLNKFSLVMHDSLPNDVDHIMNEKNEIYSKLFSYLKKNQSSTAGILLDASKLPKISFRGIGYELIPSSSSISALPGTECYHFVFLYPKQANSMDKHLKNLNSLVVSELDQKVKYYFDSVVKASYYLGKISENYTFFMILEQNKAEYKSRTISFVQEISDDLNVYKLIETLNASLK